MPELNAEPFALNKAGEKVDAFFHEPLLASPQGELASDLMVLRQALRGGMALSRAVVLYAGPETKAFLAAQGVKY